MPRSPATDAAETSSDLGVTIAKEDANHEANVSAQSNQTTAKAWVSRTDEDTCWTRGVEETTRQGKKASRRLRSLQITVMGQTDRFRRADRLRSARDFRRLSREGCRVVSEQFVMLIAPPSQCGVGTSTGWSDSHRLGITVSRKVGNAVQRNRIKRGVREWFRHERVKWASGGDLVVIARRKAGMLETRGIGPTLSRMTAHARSSHRRSRGR